MRHVAAAAGQQKETEKNGLENLPAHVRQSLTNAMHSQSVSE